MSNTQNPYASPESNVSDPEQLNTEAPILSSTINSNSAGAAWSWIKSGFANFKSSPLFWIINIIIYGLLLIILGLIPILGILVAMILSPVIIGGLMLGTYAVSQGQPMTVSHLFSGFKQHAGSLILVGIFYIIGLILLVLMAGVIGYLTNAFGGFMSLLNQPSLIIAGLFFIILGVIPLILSTIFAPALVVMHNLKPLQAMKKSFFGCMKNILPLILWFIFDFILMILGAIPFGLGLLVMYPVLTASTFFAYKSIFTD